MKSQNEVILAHDLRDRFDYDPDTGVVTAKHAYGRHGRLAAGRPIGTPNKLGYLECRFGGRGYYVHRIIWALVHGAWPQNEIDHVNGDPSDNRLTNLREATRLENIHNMRPPAVPGSAPGVKGVSWSRDKRKWHARIKDAGKSRHIGYFDNIEDAIAAREAAAITFHGQFAYEARPTAMAG